MPANPNTSPVRRYTTTALAQVGAQVRYPFPAVGALTGTVTRKLRSGRIYVTFTRPPGSNNGGNDVTFGFTQRYNGEYYKVGSATENSPALTFTDELPARG